MLKNTTKTVMLLAFLGALFLGVGSFFGRGGLIIGLVLGLVFVGGSYWFSDKVAVKAARAKAVTEQEAPQLYAIVRDLTQRADMPMPAIYIAPASQPNAFATGRNEHHAARGRHSGSPAGRRRERAARRARARDLARAQPRHPHRLGRRHGRTRDHVPRAYGHVGRAVRWRRRQPRPRRRQRVRDARDGDPRP